MDQLGGLVMVENDHAESSEQTSLLTFLALAWALEGEDTYISCPSSFTVSFLLSLYPLALIQLLSSPHTIFLVFFFAVMYVAPIPHLHCILFH